MQIVFHNPSEDNKKEFLIPYPPNSQKALVTQIIQVRTTWTASYTGLLNIINISDVDRSRIISENCHSLN